MRASALSLLAVVSCATTPGQIHVLADADTSSARAEAVRTAVRWLRDRGADEALRISAARALGRLGVAETTAVNALSAQLNNRAADRDLRCMSAWALGEFRTRASLKALGEALRLRLDAPIASYVLEGLAKHLALMANDEETLLSIVEDLVFYAGNRSRKLPALYELLSDQTRTVGVNVEVLTRTVQQTRRQPGVRQRAALYNAAFELLARLDERREQIAAGPEKWRPIVDAAVDVAGRAYRLEDVRTQVLVLYFLGRLASTPEVAQQAAPEAVKLRVARASQASLQFLAAWALDRLQLSAISPRKALVSDMLTQASDPVLLRFIADLGRRNDGSVGADAPQRWLELGGGR